MKTSRLDAAFMVTQSVGEAILALRGRANSGVSKGDQFKSPVDPAAEGWVLGFLRNYFPNDRFLCEEGFETENKPWDAPEAFWTVDALDGTRSFAGGFDGFCVQVAYVEKGAVQLGVIFEPVRQMTYWGVQGQGAFRQKKGGAREALQLSKPSWPEQPIFVDSKEPGEVVGEFKAKANGQFLECGSIGLKICRVADGQADVYAKNITFKLWDAAPGEVILNEAGGKLGLWNGSQIPYHKPEVYFNKIVAAPAPYFDHVVKNLNKGGVKS